jgi:TRAP-type C4-dicarboxylate transport system permease small subunit
MTGDRSILSTVKERYFMKIIRLIDAGLKRVMFAFLNLCIFIMTMSVIAQIVARSVFNSPLPWTEEIARIMMVWVVFTGASVLYDRTSNGHIMIDSLMLVLPPKVVTAIERVTNVLIVVFLVLLVIYGIILTQRTQMSVFAATGLSVAVIYMAVPINAVIMLFLSLRQFLDFMEKRSLAKKASTTE